MGLRISNVERNIIISRKDGRKSESPFEERSEEQSDIDIFDRKLHQQLHSNLISAKKSDIC